MPGRKGRRANNPKRGSKFITRARRKGKNKGKVARLRVYRSTDGRIHTTPQGKRYR